MLSLALVIVVAALIAGGVFINNARAAGKSAAAAPPAAQAVVDKYLGILDSGMSTSACDFSGMATVYDADARLTVSGGPFAPGGPFGSGNAFGAQQFDGIQAITGFYTKLCHILHTKGLQSPAWTQDAGFLLSPTVLNSYEHVSSGGHLVGRCMHVFVVRGERIVSLDWSVYQ